MNSIEFTRTVVELETILFYLRADGMHPSELTLRTGEVVKFEFIPPPSANNP